MIPESIREKALKKYPEKWEEVMTKQGNKYLVDINKLARAKYITKLTAENGEEA